MSANKKKVLSVREPAMQRFKESPNHFPLLALPVELAQMVYKEAFRGSMIRIYTRSQLDPESYYRIAMAMNEHPASVSRILHEQRSEHATKMTSHRNLLMTSKDVYREAIEVYWKTVFVCIPQDPNTALTWEHKFDTNIADALPAQLSPSSISQIRRLRVDTPFNTEYLLQHLPKLRKLYLTRCTATRQIGELVHSPEYFKTVWKHPDQHKFDDVPLILKHFPKLQLTVRMIVRMTSNTAQGLPPDWESWEVFLDFEKDCVTHVQKLGPRM